MTTLESLDTPVNAIVDTFWPSPDFFFYWYHLNSAGVDPPTTYEVEILVGTNWVSAGAPCDAELDPIILTEQIC